MNAQRTRELYDSMTPKLQEISTKVLFLFDNIQKHLYQVFMDLYSQGVYDQRMYYSRTGHIQRLIRDVFILFNERDQMGIDMYLNTLFELVFEIIELGEAETNMDKYNREYQKLSRAYHSTWEQMEYLQQDVFPRLGIN